MKTLSKFSLMMIFALLIFSGCNKSSKTILTGQSNWLVQNPDDSNVNHQVFKFISSDTVSFGDNIKYKITWIDGSSFRLFLDNKTVIFKFGKFDKNKTKVAILYENEKMPIKNEDWRILQQNERVLEFVKDKKGKNDKLPDFYVINGVKIPNEKIPPAGIYLTKDLNGDIYGGIKVEKDNKTVVFRTATAIDNKLMWNNSPIETYHKDGAFFLNDFMRIGVEMGGDYEGNGIISISTGANDVSEDQAYDKYVLQPPVANTHSLLFQYIKTAFEYGLIFNGEDENVGRLVKLYFYRTVNKSGCVFTVPANKIWTPLFFKYTNSGNNYYVEIPKILTERNENQGVGRMYYYQSIYDDLLTHTWWEKGSGFYVPEQKDFKSIKLSKRNVKAISGQNAIYDNGYEKDVRYTIYFLEEDMHR